MKNILTVTMNPAVDKTTKVQSIAPEIKLRCDVPRFEAGGGGINVSRALRKLGGVSTALFPSGGYSGDLMQELIRGEGINYRAVHIMEMTRINLVVTEESTGDQYRFVMPGNNLTRDEWQRVLTEIENIRPVPDIIVASGSLPPGVPEDYFAMVANIAENLGAKFVVDSSGEPLRQAVDGGVGLLKTNLREFRELTANKLEDYNELIALATDMIANGKVEELVVSLGEEGAIGVWKGGSKHFRSPTVPVISAVGAGDSMVAGIVFKLAMGKSFEKSILMGIAAGVAAVMTPGSELCTKEDALKIYSEMLEEIRNGKKTG